MYVINYSALSGDFKDEKAGPIRAYLRARNVYTGNYIYCTVARASGPRIIVKLDRRYRVCVTCTIFVQIWKEICCQL